MSAPSAGESVRIRYGPAETGWAVYLGRGPDGHDRFRIANVPLGDYGFTLGDIVEQIPEGGTLVLRLVHGQGLQTTTIWYDIPEQYHRLHALAEAANMACEGMSGPFVRAGVHYRGFARLTHDPNADLEILAARAGIANFRSPGAALEDAQHDREDV